MVKTSKLPKAQENAPVEVAFGFSFASDWSRGKGDLVHVKKYVIERLVMRGKKSIIYIGKFSRIVKAIPVLFFEEWTF